MNQHQDIPVADQRTAEILETARLVFSEKGFDGASMQDLARRSGMSVGNFYRYFPSKAAIVAALISRNLAEMEHDFAAILEVTDPMSALRDKISARITQAKCQSEGQLWAEITAAALRKPEIGQISIQMEEAILGHLVKIFAHITNIPVGEAKDRWSTHARLIVMLVKGCAMQRPELPDAPALQDLILRTVDRTLDEIALHAAKG